VPGRHRKSSKIALRVGTCAVAGIAFAGPMGAAYADTISSGASSAADVTTLPRTISHSTGHVVRAQQAPPPKRVTAKDVIALAEKQVGTSADGSGNTKFTRWYMTTPRARQTVARDGGSVGGYAGAEWCDMFVSWVGNRLGISSTFGEDPYTVTHAQWFQAQKRWGTTPKPGAVVFFSWSGGKSADAIDHVGLVVKDNGDGTIQTVEGNTNGGEVAAKTRDTSTVVGYGYPAYAK